ncbi:MAG: hypothetical protein JRJ19_13970, partial [Deltaproteobacteria bacterium]|nr:hypothetical protein [Deltaproteobacteria bacterium]
GEKPAEKEPEKKPAAEKLPADDPLNKILAALDEPVSKCASLALIRPEGTGTSEDLSGLEELIRNHLALKENLTVIEPETVFKKVGPEFAVSPEGISKVAQKLDAAAALFVRVFKTAKQYEIHLWLVNSEGLVLLDESIPVPAIPPSKQPPETELTATVATVPTEMTPPESI